MTKHRCPRGVKVARFPRMSKASGSIPVSGLCLLIFVVFLVFTGSIPVSGLCITPFLLTCVYL